MATPPSRRSSEDTLEPSTEYSNLPMTTSHWRIFSLKGTVTKDVLNTRYDGSGTEDDPFVISFIDNDSEDPKHLPNWRKWSIVATVSFLTFVTAFGSSIYTGVLREIESEFQASEEVAITGLSLYILGLALGPLVWSPMSELVGRKMTMFVSTAGCTIFNGGVTASQNIQTLLILRFFAGAFASAPMTNSNGSMADIFEPAQRSLAFGFYAITPFMGPVLGPTIGGYLGTAAGWRWVMGFLTIISGLSWVMGIVLVPETFGEVLLRRRAKALSKLTGRNYISKVDTLKGPLSPREVYQKALIRPWAILFLEPIVFSLSFWLSTVYGTLYLFIAGFPFVFEDARGWSPGASGLALLGIGIGTLVASIINIPINRRFAKKAKEGNGHPEVRLQPAMVGGIAIPLGIFWFAWTNAPSIHWSCSIIGSSFFGFGIVIIWTSINNYLVDAYKVWAASALAGQVVWRSMFGAIFPLFTGYMFRGIGIHWASSVPGFVALVCAPLPFVFYKYGAQIRQKSRYASQAEEATKALTEKKEDV